MSSNGSHLEESGETKTGQMFCFQKTASDVSVRHRHSERSEAAVTSPWREGSGAATVNSILSSNTEKHREI